MSDLSFGKLFDVHIDSTDTVLAIRAKVQTLLLEGKTIMDQEGEGQSWKKVFGMPLDQLLIATTQFLKEADPATYGYPIRSMRVFRA